jgi:membrane-associated phospholipid phosphatase
MHVGKLRHPAVCAIAVVLAFISFSISAHASDEVLDWIHVMNTTVIAGGTSPLVSGRVVALVSSSVFDAVNGIEPRYDHFLVEGKSPRPASQRAAAIEAAYTMLMLLYPAQTAALTNARNASLAALSGAENQNAIKNGMDWGDTVANTVFAIRSNDGFTPNPPPFWGVLGATSPTSAVGAWRPTPTGATGGNASGAAPQFASMTPWVLIRPSQFRLPPPYASAPTGTASNIAALTRADYATDYNELKTMGTLTNSGRSDDQSALALFWAGNTPLYWNRIAADLSAQRQLSLRENARLFALLNVAIGDAAIACWDSKYRYVFWRPITAIRNGDIDNNAGTIADPNWAPFLDSHPVTASRGTPAHPEYPSGHSTVSGAAAWVLEQAFGDNNSFSVNSDVMPGTRSYSSFSEAVAEIADARVFGGIHFRSSCIRGNMLGRQVATYVAAHAFGNSHGEDVGGQ